MRAGPGWNYSRLYSHLNVAAVGLVEAPEEVGELLYLELRQTIFDVRTREIISDPPLGVVELNTESSTHPSLVSHVVSHVRQLESGGLNSAKKLRSVPNRFIMWVCKYLGVQKLERIMCRNIKMTNCINEMIGFLPITELFHLIQTNISAALFNCSLGSLG